MLHSCFTESILYNDTISDNEIVKQTSKVRYAMMEVLALWHGEVLRTNEDV